MAKTKPKPKTPAKPRATANGPVPVRLLRKKLGLTQEDLASLIGTSFVSVNKWENNASKPTGLSAVLLELLSDAMKSNKPDKVVTWLRAAGPKPVSIVRALVAMSTDHG